MAILEFEQHARSANIRTYGDALWCAVTTVSTVGYGDRYPVTLGGRITAVLLIGAGVTLFGVITAAVAAYFIRRVTNHPAPEGEDLAARLERLQAAVTGIEHALATEIQRHEDTGR